MTQKQVQIITVQSILQSSQTYSQPSLPASFDMNDIMNQNLQEPRSLDNYDDFPQQQDDSASITLTKKSETTKTISKIDQLRTVSMVLKQESSKDFVLKQTPLNDKIFSKNVTFMNIGNVSKPFQTSNKFIGLPTSISATSSKFLAVGTSQSSVALFQMGVKNYKLMETVNKNKYGSVNTISISKDNLFMVCGYQNGYLTIWDLATFSLTKTIQSQMNTQSILKVEFIKNNQFISSDLQGNVMIHTIQKYLWTSVKSIRLINKSYNSVYYDIRSLKLVNNRYSTALISFDSLLLISIDPVEILFKFQRPENAPQSSIPVADLGLFRNNETQQNYILISWGPKLYIYTFNLMSRTQPFQLKAIYQHNLNVISIQILSSNSFILLDNNGTYRIINLIYYLNNLPNFIKNQGLLKNDILTGKCSINEDLKQKNTANTICKTIDRYNQMFFITEGGMFRCRFHKWTQMIYYLIQNKQYLSALKCAIQIFNGRLDIFSQKVVISPKTMVLFNDMITYYLSMRLKQINTLTESQMREIIITSIQFCIQIHSYDHIFSKVFSFLDRNYHLQKLFLQCLEPFIKTHSIKRIPNFVLLQKIIAYYSQQDPVLVDMLILSLDPLSIDYFATLNVCVTHKLYRSLVYVSEINNDFVSPANKIIESCVKIRNNGGSSETIEEYTSYLYFEIIKLFQGKTIADTSLSENSIRLGISTLSLWFIIEENARQLVNFNGVLYFQTLQNIFSNQIAIEALKQDSTNNLPQKLFLILRGMAAGLKEYQQALANLIIQINQKWNISKQMVEYSIKHLNRIDSNTFAFIDKNSQYIQEIVTKNQKLKQTLPKQIQALIFLQNKKYEQALDIFQVLSDQQLQLLFSRLNLEILRIYLQKLVNLDPDATANFVYQHHPRLQIPLLFQKISPNGNAYLFLRRLKRLDSNNEIPWSKQNQLFYLQYICKFKNQGRVLYELQKSHKSYHLEKLHIIKKYKLKECEAYLSSPQDAFFIYKEVYIIKFAHEYQELIKFKYSNASEFDRVLKAIYKILHSESNIVQFFHFVLKQFNLSGRPGKKIGEQIQNIAKKKAVFDNPFITRLKLMIEQFMFKCAAVCNQSQLVSIILQNKQVFALKFIFNSVVKALSKLSLNIKIFDIISSILKNDDIDTFDKVLQQKAMTYYCKPICRSCSLFLIDGISTSHVFPCGHCFHSECILSYQTCQICDTNMFLKKNERRPTIMLQETRRRNYSIKKCRSGSFVFVYLL